MSSWGVGTDVVSVVSCGTNKEPTPALIDCDTGIKPTLAIINCSTGTEPILALVDMGTIARGGARSSPPPQLGYYLSSISAP